MDRIHTGACALLAMASLASCTQEPPPASTPEPAASAAPAPAPVAPPANPQQSLLGQWEVAEIGGEKPEYTRMILVMGEDSWHIQSQCISFSGDYRVDGKSIDFAPIERRFPAVEARKGPLYAMCARRLSPAEQQVRLVLTGLRPWTTESVGRIVIDSPKGPLIAHRLGETIGNPMEYTEWDPATTFGDWRVVSLSAEPVEDARLIFGGSYLTLSVGCAYYQWMWWSDMEGNSELAQREPFRSGCRRAATPEEARLATAITSLGRPRADGPDGRIFPTQEGELRLER